MVSRSPLIPSQIFNGRAVLLCRVDADDMEIETADDPLHNPHYLIEEQNNGDRMEETDWN